VEIDDTTVSDTHLYRLIAGFERPDSGTVELGGADVTRQPPYARDVNTVFQDYALFPHMSVLENVGYGMRVRRVPRAERRRRAEAALEMVRLSGHSERKPVQLSGGQRQRVALARALLAGSGAILMDDPLSAVDTETERTLLRTVGPALRGRTVLVATQRLSTVVLADRAVVLRDGKLVEQGTPEELAALGGDFTALFGDETRAA